MAASQAGSMRPLSRPSPIRSLGRASLALERCCQHQFQIAFGQYHVTVFEAQDFTLFRDAQLSLKTVERLRVDGAVCRAAAAPDRTTAAMKEPQMFTPHALATLCSARWARIDPPTCWSASRHLCLSRNNQASAPACCSMTRAACDIRANSRAPGESSRHRCRSSIDSNSGTGIRPCNPSPPSTCTPAMRASPTTRSTSSAEAAPLIT